MDKGHELLSELFNGDEEQTERVARRIAARGAELLPILQDLLTDSDSNRRWWAVRILAEIKDPQVPLLLVNALWDPDSAVRQCSALALRLQPTPAAIPDLISCLGSEDQLLARLAADALIAMGAESVPFLLDAMNNGPRSARLETVRALALIGDQRAIPALFAALEDDSALVEYWANEGLERMGVGMVFLKPGEQ